MKKNALVLWVLSLALISFCSGSGEKMADKIFVNGKIWTVAPRRPWVEAVAVSNGKISAVGSNKEIRKLVGSKTQVIDLENGFVLPGFIDSHTHFMNGGFSLMSIQLRDAISKEEFVVRIAEKAKSLSKGEWILNGDWDHEQFTPPELPRKEWIDKVTPDNPVCINRLDGHMILANSLALKISGVTKITPVPAGGEIVKDSKDRRADGHSQRRGHGPGLRQDSAAVP